MFLHLSVSHSVHRGRSASVQCPLGADTLLGADPPWEQTPLWEQTPPSAQCMVGERAVRILLECILVLEKITLHNQQYLSLTQNKI